MSRFASSRLWPLALLGVLATGCQYRLDPSGAACGPHYPTPAISAADSFSDQAERDLSPAVVNEGAVPPVANVPELLDSGTGGALYYDPTVAPLVTECPPDDTLGSAAGLTPPCDLEHGAGGGDPCTLCETAKPWWCWPWWPQPGFCLPWGGGPLFHRGLKADLVEEELRPPHSRFHPVPTQPVFEPRLEYSPPELMMTESRKHGAGACGQPTVPDWR
jgi:hypothetical protein